MRKQNRQVRFSDEQGQPNQGTKMAPPAEDHLDGIGDLNNRSLLSDESNGTSVTPFNLEAELDEGNFASIIASRSSENEDGGNDDDDDENEGLENRLGEDLSSDEDVQQIESPREKRRRTRNEEDNWEYDDSDREAGDTEQIVREQKLRKTEPPSVNEADAVGTIAQYLQREETVSQGLERLDRIEEPGHVQIKEAVNVLGSVANCRRDDVIGRIKKWELSWGAVAGQKPHGPFAIDQLHQWARAHYFVQGKVGWVRGVGGSRWCRADSIFQ